MINFGGQSGRISPKSIFKHEHLDRYMTIYACRPRYGRNVFSTLGAILSVKHALHHRKTRRSSAM
jgi:hypothetical protein